MFSQVSVCPQGVGHVRGTQAPPGQACPSSPPWPCMPPPTHDPLADTMRCAQWVGATHPTGMHSCLVRRIEQKHLFSPEAHLTLVVKAVRKPLGYPWLFIYGFSHETLFSAKFNLDCKTLELLGITENFHFLGNFWKILKPSCRTKIQIFGKKFHSSILVLENYYSLEKYLGKSNGKNPKREFFYKL